MNKRLLLIALCVLAAIGCGWARTWTPDSLAGYERTTIVSADSTVCTVVRKLSPHSDGRSVLYVHGYNDYFFQAEEGDRFVDSCYNFYAVDLHGYGRSLKPGEVPYQSRSISDYYRDIDSALVVMREEGTAGVALMGHSTGGLISASYMAFAPSPMVDVLLLNSPFLDFNMSGFKRKVLLPLLSCVGSHFPNISISQGDDTAYGESLSADFHGEWHFNYAWKTVHPRKITSGWVHMIKTAQNELRNHPESILVPILLMHSDNTVKTTGWSPAHRHGDAVLDVEHISSQGRLLGPDVTELTVQGGLHDLFLSAPAVRRALYDAVFSWLRANWRLGRGQSAVAVPSSRAR